MPTQEDINDKKELLAIHRQNLEQYLKQQAMLGTAFAPPMVTNGIREERNNIRRVKEILRDWKQQVDDHPDDEGASSEPALTVRQLSIATPLTTADQSARNTSPTDSYDVYISYHPADKEWARKELLPLLEKNGLHVTIDFRDFEIGVPKIVNIERAVERSRHTLIVMTPDWVRSEWNEFQGLLASTANPTGLQQKLIPLMYKSCTPPARIAFLEVADLTDPEEREIQLDRLIRSLKRSRS
jgi:TIR domain